MLNIKIGTISSKIHTPYEGMYGLGTSEILKILTGNGYIDLTNAVANKLVYLKLYGGTELVPETYIDSVTAEGKCVQRNLPEGYTQVEYIQSSGTQYIDTGIYVATGYKVRVKAYATSLPTTSAFFGCTSVASSSDAYKGVYRIIGNGINRCAWGNGGSSIVGSLSGNDSINTWYDMVCDNGAWTIDGTLFATCTTATFTSEYSMWLFARNTGGEIGLPASCRISVCQIWDNNGQMVQNLIPCKDSSNEVGMYDTVSGTFLTNQGTGDFTAGSDVVPSPATPMDIVCNNGVIKYSLNMFDGQMEQGAFGSSTGLPVDNDNWIRSVNYIDVKPSTTYTLSCSPVTSKTVEMYVIEYTSDNTFVRMVTQSPAGNVRTWTIHSTAAKIKFQIGFSPREAVNVNTFSNIQVEKGSSATTYNSHFGIYTDGTTETVTDNVSNVATCQRLLSVGTYKDTQEILSGAVTRNVGIALLDGTEDWVFFNGYAVYSSSGATTLLPGIDLSQGDNTLSICNCFSIQTPNSFPSSTGGMRYGTIGGSYRILFTLSNTGATDASSFKQWVANQYNAGTPVIIVYPLATATTETVTGQFLSKAPVTYTGSISSLTGTTVTSSHTTPTPTQPLQINCNNGVLKYGNVSKNLFNEDYGTLTSGFIYKPLYLGVGTYTCSYSLPAQAGNTSMVYFLNGNVSGGASNNVNQVDANTSRTVTTSTGYVTIAYRKGDSINLPDKLPSDYNCMIESGDRATTYEPYRLAVYPDGTTEKVEIHTKNLFDEQWNRNTGVSTSSATWGQVVSANGWSTSGLVPVKTGQEYTVSYNTTLTSYIFYYEADGTMQQSYDLVTSGNKKTFTVPNGATQIRLQVNKNTEAQISDLKAQLEKGSTATTYEPYYNGGSATAEMLLKLGDYKDVQEVLEGDITRNIGIRVFDGTETWTTDGVSTTYGTNFKTEIDDAKLWTLGSTEGICNKFNAISDSVGKANIPTWCFRGSSASKAYWFRSNLHSTTTEWKQWLKDQYDAGTPVILVYPLATATTETVTGQTLNIQAGTNRVEITEASMDNLPLEVSYYATE